HRHIHGIDVTATNDRPAVVVIDLPNTTLTGRVVRENGTAVAKATVNVKTLSDGARTASTTTEPDGSFTVYGYPPGTVVMDASAPQSERRMLQSEQMQVEVQEDVRTAVTLVVRESMKVAGYVTTVDGVGIPGAIVKTVPAHEPTRLSFSEETDVRGYFHAEVATGTNELLVRVGAIGYGYRIALLSVREGVPLQIVLSPLGGTLVLKGAAAHLRDYSTSNAFLIHNGGFDSPRALLNWADANGGGIRGDDVVVPQMEPGKYSQCTTRTAELTSLIGKHSPVTKCAEGRLYTAQTLDLAIDME
ncbi:MAG: carboxypeptidase-like regulatory domain-containing protein, partial [Vicinamibacteria bacterium]